MIERISREELVKIYNIEISFFNELVEYGLLKVETEDNITYVLYEDLPAFEKYTNWHYDLEINLPGLEVIQDMLHKIENLKQRNRELVNKLTAMSERHQEE
ncbi:chaperone modulator CbpM [Chryseobacterium sp.]|uniref:chaperone modulator CbpM n=1 Tax=Chryseobacterium sp. TaxID=1871047 RepID=UPI0025C2F117|nr:chaperone modulator CbpM [Chryseobacterium sp.]